jgi:hypothetical protein
MKARLYWFACWACYYVGDTASKIINLFDGSNAWVCFWYSIYSKCMSWSSSLQNAAGYDPHKVDDVSSWVWRKVKDNTGEK